MSFKKRLFSLLAFASVGVVDAGYLVYEHYSHKIPPCSTNFLFADCGKVLNSSYATINNIPVAALGVIFYTLIILLVLAILKTKKRKLVHLLYIVTSVGIATSVVLVYLQIFVIKAICFYCILSAINTLILFLISRSMISSLKINFKLPLLYL